MKKAGIYICILISLGYVSIVYHKTFFHPNNYLFYPDGDAIKNYYNYCWHAKCDKTFFQLGGTGYPFGESLLMEDSLPLYSSILKIISIIFPSITNYSIGILNFLLLFSLVIGSFFMYFIYRHFLLPPILSALSANATCLLSSQVLLLSPYGHFGLAFVCFFPIGWFILIKYFQDTHKLKWSVLIGINIIIWTFTHVYLGYILLMFTFLSHLFYHIIYFKKSFKIVAILKYIGVQIIMPITIIFLLIKLTDNHPDRVNMPFTDSFSASFNAIFTPLLSPFKSLYQLIFDLTIKDPLSWCNIGNYIGLTSNLAIITFIIYSTYYIVKKKNDKILGLFPNFLTCFIISALVMLLYSMAIPLKFLPRGILDIFPIINQFSSFGRFAWAFYFVIVTFSIVLFYNILYKNLWGKVIFFVLIFLYFAEGLSYHLKESKEICKYPNTFNTKNLRESQKIFALLDKNKFQAIIPIPYYFIYTLPFETANSNSSIYESMVASYNSGLPIICTYLSRPSLTESMAIFKQLMIEPYRIMLPQIVKDGRDIAVIINNNEFGIINENEKAILKVSKLYEKNQCYSIYSLSVKDFIPNKDTNLTSLYNNIAHNYKNFNGLMVKDTNCFIVYDNFNSRPSSVSYFGSGAAQGMKTNTNVLFKTDTKNIDISKSYIVSFWYYNHLWDQTYNSLIIYEKDKNGNSLQLQSYTPYHTNIIDGWWYLVEDTLKIKSRNSILSIYFHGDDYYERWFAIDEFLFRPDDVDAYLLVKEKNSNYIIKNNRKLGYRF